MIAPGAELAPIYTAVLDERLEWLISTDIFFEYLEKLGVQSSGETAARLRQVFQFSASIVVVEPSYRWRLVSADADDDKFVDCAVAGNADYLITDDRHYRKLKDVKFPKLRVVTARQFLNVLAKAEIADS